MYMLRNVMLCCIFVGCSNYKGTTPAPITPSNTPSRAPKTIYVPQDYATPDQALRNAQTGDRVEIGHGTWATVAQSQWSTYGGTQYPLIVPDGVTLQSGPYGGPAAGPALTVFDMDGPNQVPILEVGNNVTIKGIIFKSSSGKIPAVLQSQGVRNVTIRNCDIRTRSGLVFDGAQWITIEECTIALSPLRLPSGAPLAHGVKVTASNDITLRRNTITAFDHNIHFEQCNAVRVEENIIVRGARGISVDDTSFHGMTAEYNDVWGNTEGMVNATSGIPFFPATGGNITADPLFVNRDDGGFGKGGTGFRIQATSPCATAGPNGRIGAEGTYALTIAPAIQQGVSPQGSQGRGSKTELLRFELTTNGQRHVFMSSGLRLFVTDLRGTVADALYLYDAGTGTIFGGETFRVGNIHEITLNQNFLPWLLNPGDRHEYWIGTDTTNLASGTTLEIRFDSMEWVINTLGGVVNDGASPVGLPIRSAPIIIQ